MQKQERIQSRHPTSQELASLHIYSAGDVQPFSIIRAAHNYSNLLLLEGLLKPLQPDLSLQQIFTCSPLQLTVIPATSIKKRSKMTIMIVY